MFKATEQENVADFGANKTKQPGIVAQALDLFNEEDEEDEIQGCHELLFRPITSVSGNRGPYTISMPNPTDLALDLSSVRLHVELSAEKRAIAGGAVSNIEGVDLPGDPEHRLKPTGLVNNIMGNLWKLLELYLNNKLVSTASSADYSIISYVEHTLNFAEGAEESHLKCSMWEPNHKLYDDEANGKLMPSHIHGVPEKRLNEFEGGKKVWLNDLCFTEIIWTDQVLLGHVNVDFRFIRHVSDEYMFVSLDTDHTFSMNISDMYISVNQYVISPSVLAYWNKKLNGGAMANYGMTRVSCTTQQIIGGIRYFRSNALFRGQLPHLMIVGIQPSNAYVGTLDSFPTRFYHHNLESMKIYYNSVPIPSEMTSADWGTDNIRNLYRYTLDSVGFGTKPVVTPNFSFDKFKQGTTLLAFDCSSSRTSGSALEPAKHGVADFEVKFSKPTPASGLIAVVVSYYNDYIKIDGQRNIWLSHELRQN